METGILVQFYRYKYNTHYRCFSWLVSMYTREYRCFSIFVPANRLQITCKSDDMTGWKARSVDPRVARRCAPNLRRRPSAAPWSRARSVRPHAKITGRRPQAGIGSRSQHSNFLAHPKLQRGAAVRRTEGFAGLRVARVGGSLPPRPAAAIGFLPRSGSHAPRQAADDGAALPVQVGATQDALLLPVIVFEWPVLTVPVSESRRIANRVGHGRSSELMIVGFLHRSPTAKRYSNTPAGKRKSKYRTDGRRPRALREPERQRSEVSGYDVQPSIVRRRAAKVPGRIGQEPLSLARAHGPHQRLQTTHRRRVHSRSFALAGAGHVQHRNLVNVSYSFIFINLYL